MQNSLFDLENRYASLSKTGDPLERLNAIILETAVNRLPQPQLVA